MAGVTSFGHASGDAVVSLGSEAWNIADGYTKIKILRLLIEVDLYESMALYGYKDLDDVDYIPSEVPRRRVEAINRIMTDLQQLIGNCMFSIRTRKDRKKVDVMVQRFRKCF